MTDHAKKQVQRRRKTPIRKRRRKRVLLLALVLILGSWAFLFHKEKLYAVPEIFTWLKLNKGGKILASVPSASPRGDIYDRNFRPLAVTYETYALYARPLEMENPAASASLLEEILGLEHNGLLASLKSERGFVWIAKGIDQNLAGTIKESNIKGIYQVVETKRFYPNYDTAAHAIGFVENGQGLDGIEFQYNTLLRGDELNNAELEALHFSPDIEFSRAGSHLVLNLDLMIQAKIEHFLKKRVQITGAAKGAVLLMDANTGGIVAMASYPVFNPNLYWKFSSSALNNHIVTEPVYPGELALIFQQAAAINFKNTKNSQSADSVPVIEPEILKRKLSTAPRVDSVDPEYLAKFTKHLGFGQRILTDIPLKDETPLSTSLNLKDPSFHSSALQLLRGFTSLLNNGKVVTPHLLNKAYPRERPIPLEPTLTRTDQTVPLHPDTSRDIIDFLAAKWLKMNRRTDTAKEPMFFETHRYATALKKSKSTRAENVISPPADSIPHITQSVMLGAMPGRDPKLTMLAILSYPDSYDEVYPDALESFGNKFSILSPDQVMIQKMLNVTAQSPPVPSPDFWTNGGNSMTANLDPHSSQNRDISQASNNSQKTMPDVTGKSLRAGLQELQHYTLDIKLFGSGRIVSQEPAAGTEIKDITECILQMQQEI